MRYLVPAGDRRRGPALARHLRPARAPDGRHLPQHGPGRFLGARRRSAVSADVYGARAAHRAELRGVCDDALSGGLTYSMTMRHIGGLLLAASAAMAQPLA